MEILKSAVILVIGFVLLIKGADYFVEGSSSVAKKFKVPSLIIGMTIVAMEQAYRSLRSVLPQPWQGTIHSQSAMWQDPIFLI